MFQKILIANRGEIAVRIIRTARKLGIRTVAVYAADDAPSVHVSLADEAFLLQGTSLKETYLNQELLIRLARQSGAQAIHPGYGFLSENAAFAQKTEEAGFIFIGATPDQIRLMGSKTEAIDFAVKLQIPVIPGIRGTSDEITQMTGAMEFPLLVKAAAGGGGKGMEIIHRAKDLPAALQRARRQANEYFGNDVLFVEKFLPAARHIEVQLFGDGAGNVIHLFERECSTQRRYQKLIEESPAVSVSPALKEKLFRYALSLGEAIKYRGVGTVEFLVDEFENCFFLEMNTRLQVEHPVTEMITGLDLVELQFRAAAGMGLQLSQNEVKQQGHAIEARVCAEDPETDFFPSSGLIRAVEIPEDVRWDSFISGNKLFPAAYDSLAGKLVVHDFTRERAIEKMHKSLENLLIGGVKTNQLFLLGVIRSETFRTNKMTTCFLEEQLHDLLSLLHEEREQIPVNVVLVAYLLHHFYRLPRKSDPWFNHGWWRIFATFEVEVEQTNCKVTMLRKDDGCRMEVNQELLEVSVISFQENKVIFKLDDDFYEIPVFETDHATVVQFKAHQFALKSRQVPGQIEPEKKNVRNPAETQLTITAGLFGKVVDVFIEPGDRLIKGQDLLIIESMKTEFIIQSPVDAVVKAIHASRGKMVQDKEVLVDLE